MSLFEKIFKRNEKKLLREKLDQFLALGKDIEKEFAPVRRVFWYHYEESLKKKLDEIAHINIKEHCSTIIELLNKRFRVHKDMKEIYDRKPSAYKKLEKDIFIADGHLPSFKIEIQTILRDIPLVKDYEQFSDLNKLQTQLRILLIKVSELEKNFSPIIPLEKQKPHHV